MMDLWTVLIPILITDIVNPVLFAAAVYAVSTSRPIANSGALILGHTVTYFSAGIVIAIGLEKVTHRLANPESIDFVISLILGVLLIGIAFSMGRGKKAQDPTGKMSELTPLKAFGFGAIINIIGIPFALPYFAAINEILKSDLSVTASVITVAGYNLLYAAPFLAVPILAAALGERSKPLLEKVNSGLEKVSAFLMPALLGLVGVALTIDALSYFLTGKGLY